MSVVAQNNLFLWRHLGEVLHACEEDVPVRKHPHVVVFPAGASGVRPDDLAIIDEENLVIALSDMEHGMLGDSPAGQSNGSGLVPLARRDLCLGRAHGGHAGGAEAAEQLQQRRSLGRLGDAVTTMNLDSFLDTVARRKQVCRPPVPATSNWKNARRSVELLAGLRPWLIAAATAFPCGTPPMGCRAWPGIFFHLAGAVLP